MRRLLLALAIVLFTAPVYANTIACTEAAFEAEIDRINTCANYTDTGCTKSERVIKFNCSGGTIYIEAEHVARKRCNAGVWNNDNPVDCTFGLYGCQQSIGLTCGSSSPDDSKCYTASGAYVGPCELRCDGSSNARALVCDYNDHGCRDDVADTKCTSGSPPTPYKCCTGIGTGNCCEGDSTDRIITADWVEIDGTAADGVSADVKFVLDPPCWYNAFGGRAENDGCTEVEGADALIKIRGHHIKVHDIQMYYFYDGINVDNKNTTVEDVEIYDNYLFRNCDNTFTGTGVSPVTSVFPKDVYVHDNTVKWACDKGFQVYGPKPNVAWTYPNFNYTFENNDFIDCRVGLSIPWGRFKVIGNTFTESTTNVPDWEMHEGILVGNGATAYLQDNTITGAREGLVLNYAASTVVSLGGNTIQDSDYNGVRVSNGKSLFNYDTIINNGTKTGTNYIEGGIVYSAFSTASLGGGNVVIDDRSLASVGQNTIYGNKEGTTLKNVVNNTNTTVKAENNWWGTATGPVGLSPAAKIDADPWLTEAPTGTIQPPTCGDGTLDADAGETCDDGNVVSGDGCDENCQIEVVNVPALAFPSAQGLGKDSVGGRNGIVITVNTTTDSTSGTHKECVGGTANGVACTTIGAACAGGGQCQQFLGWCQPGDSNGGTTPYWTDATDCNTDVQCNGGSGGQCIHAPLGSFRRALLTTRPRYVLFDVSGNITATGGDITVRGASRGYLTIAGQSAPSPGVTVSDGFNLGYFNEDGEINEVIMRHMRFLHSAHVLNPNSLASNSTFVVSGEDNGKSWTAKPTTNIMIDHCSFYWGPDQTFTVEDKVKGMTVQKSIIAEAIEPGEMGNVCWAARSYSGCQSRSGEVYGGPYGDLYCTITQGSGVSNCTRDAANNIVGSSTYCCTGQLNARARYCGGIAAPDTDKMHDRCSSDTQCAKYAVPTNAPCTATNLTGCCLPWDEGQIVEGGANTGHGLGALQGSYDGKGSQPDSTQETYYLNLFAHNFQRNPKLTSGKIHDVINNVIYNWGNISGNGPAGMAVGAYDAFQDEYNMQANVQGNYYKPGPSTTGTLQGPTHVGGAGTLFYIAGNYYEPYDGRGGSQPINPNCNGYCASQTAEWAAVIHDGVAYRPLSSCTSPGTCDGPRSYTCSDGSGTFCLANSDCADGVTCLTAAPRGLQTCDGGADDGKGCELRTGTPPRDWFDAGARIATAGDIPIITAVDAYDAVLADVGANKPAPYVEDTRVINEVRNKTGAAGCKTAMVSDQVGPWELDECTVAALTQTTRAATWDSDGDGMPDYWEAARAPALDPDVYNDTDTDSNWNNYPDIEDYLNEAAGDGVQYAPGTGCVCGNGIVDDTPPCHEQCDGGAGCDANCTLTGGEGVCGDEITDPFTTSLAGWVDGWGTWTITNGTRHQDTTTSYNNFDVYGTATSVGSPSYAQWIKVKFATIKANSHGGVLLRVPNADGSGVSYSFSFYGDGTDKSWYFRKRVGTTTVGNQWLYTNVAGASCTNAACNGLQNVTNGTTIGVAISGTGTDTLLEAWLEPQGDRGSWGPATWSFTCTSASVCNADTGRFIGLNDINGDGPKTIYYDDLWAGGCDVSLATCDCGDGNTQSAPPCNEQCDDGNLDDTDDCLTDCTFARCGDGYIQAGVEQCDGGDCCDATTCTFTTATCDDGLGCTQIDTCDGAGLCVGSNPQPCDDGVAGTVDTCVDDPDGAWHCTHEFGFQVCGDHQPTGTEQCDPTTNTDTDCCTRNCMYEAADTPCKTDGLYCTLQGRCNATGVCQNPAARSCDDGNACTADSCNDTTDACVNTPTPGAPCDDGLFCTNLDVCVGSTCTAGPARTCDDSEVCTDDSCDEDNDTCINHCDATNDPDCKCYSVILHGGELRGKEQ